jgi:regulatory protein
MADQDPLAWLTDWVTENRSAEPQEPTVNPWADSDARAPARTAAARVHSADEHLSTGEDAQVVTGSDGVLADGAGVSRRRRVEDRSADEGGLQSSDPVVESSAAQPVARTTAQGDESAGPSVAQPVGQARQLAELRAQLAEVEQAPRMPVADLGEKPRPATGSSDDDLGLASRSSQEPAGAYDGDGVAGDRVADLRAQLARVEQTREQPRQPPTRERRTAESSRAPASPVGDGPTDLFAEPWAQGEQAGARPARRSTRSARQETADHSDEPKSARRSGRRGREGPPAPVANTEAKAKDICLQQLTSRPRTRAELKKALLRKGIEEEIADKVLERLDDVGLIDDKAFAEMWVRSRHAYQGLGRRALSVELRRRGVDNETVAEAVASVDSDAEEERARQLVRKRLPAMGSADQPTKIRRLVGMLARKGYAQGLAYRVVKDELATVGEETNLLDES